MSRLKTILMTGGTGFLGGNLLNRLVNEEYRIILLKRESSDTWRIRNILDKIETHNMEEIDLPYLFRHDRIDIIVHCATNYGRKEIDPIALLEANLLLPLKLLQLGSSNQTACFINTDTILDKRINYYSLSKSQLKDWLKLYAGQMICINVALEHFYGPYDDKTKFVTYIIQSILNNAHKIELTQGEQKRDFIYIDEAVDAFLTIIKHSDLLGKGFINYEIGTGRSCKIRDFVTLVKKLANNDRTHLDFGALPYRENEVMESTVDTSEIRKLGWEPRLSLAEGLEKTINMERRRIEA